MVQCLRCALINYLILPKGRRPEEGEGGDGEVKRKRRVEVLVKRSRDPAGSKDKVREPGGAKIIWKKKDETDGKSKNQLEIVFFVRTEEGVEFEALQTRTVATAGGQMCANVCNANSIQESHNGDFATFLTLFFFKSAQ